MTTSESAMLDVAPRPGIYLTATLIVLQIAAGLFFLFDEITEHAGAPGLTELLVATALLAGIIYTGRMLRTQARAIADRDATIAVASGAIGDLIDRRFAEWRLSPAESDVALLALKGVAVQDIARLRGAAQGTVRSQLSQVYGKAGVAGQPMLMSLFLEDLIDPLLERAR